VVEKEVVEVAVLHLEGEASVWWFKPLVHSRVSSFAEFSQGLITTFDEERTKEERLTSPWEDDCTNAATALEDQPSISIEEEAIALEGKSIAATQIHPKTHQGMAEIPLFILANHLKNCGNSDGEIQESNHMATLEPHSYTALCKWFKEEMNPRPHELLMSLTQPSRLDNRPLERR